MFGAPVPPVLEAFASFLGEPKADQATTLKACSPTDAPVWAPPELRVFAVAPAGELVGVVVAHPEQPAPDWPIATYSAATGAQLLGQTARSALATLVERYLPESPDEIVLSLLRVRLAVAAEPTGAWPRLEGLSRVTIADGIDLVVPRHTVDPADFRQARGIHPLLPCIVALAKERPGSALALCRAAAFEAFRRGDGALGAQLRVAMAPMYRSLGRPIYARACEPG